jgi:uncharacterized protein YdhG (YjbR/CyaY superfamily)
VDREVQHYLESVPRERRQLVEKLHGLIIGLYPQATVDMSYRMPTYRAKDGWVALANQKHHVSLYTCGAHHLADFKEKHPGIRTGKGCINFKVTDRIPVAAVKTVIRHAMEHSSKPL